VSERLPSMREERALAALDFLSDRIYHQVFEDGSDGADHIEPIRAALTERAECPYCAGDMCARFDGLGCTHGTAERHGYDIPPSGPETIEARIEDERIRLADRLGDYFASRTETDVATIASDVQFIVGHERLGSETYAQGLRDAGYLVDKTEVAE
jgi:uncharacterized protein (DUF2164 family)